jgi:hypothetical protein
MTPKNNTLINACEKMLVDRIDIGAMPPYSIARSVEMPKGFEYPHGALSFRLNDLQCTGVNKIDSDSVVEESKDNRRSLTFKLAALELNGHYIVEAKEDPLITMDTAGNLDELSAAPTITDKQYDQLQQARAQRDILDKTANGKVLVDTFNEHNEVYNTIFRNNTALREKWQANGATQEMADHTSDAITNGQAVNPAKSTKTFGPQKVGYNENAFQQQNYITMACLFPPPGTPQEEIKKYNAAAKAASSFRTKVETLGNNSQNIPSMTSTDVYSHVNGDNGEWPEVTDEHLDAYREIAMAENGEIAEDIDRETELNGVVFSAQQRKGLRDMYVKMMKQYAEESKIERVPLWKGQCSANLHGTAIEMDLETGDINVTLPPFDLEIDDSQWTGAAEDVAGKRLTQAHFMRGLIHEYVAERLKKVVSQAMEKALNATP